MENTTEKRSNICLRLFRDCISKDMPKEIYDTYHQYTLKNCRNHLDSHMLVLLEESQPNLSNRKDRYDTFTERK